MAGITEKRPYFRNRITEMTLEVVNNAIISQVMPHFLVTVTMSVLHHVQDTTTVSQNFAKL